jgi:hypothetical protein
LLVLFVSLTLLPRSAAAQTSQVSTTHRGILFRCLQDKWPDIQVSGDGDQAFVPGTGQNLAWDSDKKTWIDTKTLQPVPGGCNTLRGGSFRYCLQKKWPDIQISGDGDQAFVPGTGQNLAWDSDKQAWIDTKTLECVCPICPASQAAVLIPDYLILDITPSSPILYVDILKADASTAGTPKPSEETQKVEEKKSSWWETVIPALIPEIGIGGGREDRERRFPDDRRR